VTELYLTQAGSCCLLFYVYLENSAFCWSWLLCCNVNCFTSFFVHPQVKLGRTRSYAELIIVISVMFVTCWYYVKTATHVIQFFTAW